MVNFERSSKPISSPGFSLSGMRRPGDQGVLVRTAPGPSQGTGRNRARRGWDFGISRTAAARFEQVVRHLRSAHGSPAGQTDDPAPHSGIPPACLCEHLPRSASFDNRQRSPWGGSADHLRAHNCRRDHLCLDPRPAEAAIAMRPAWSSVGCVSGNRITFRLLRRYIGRPQAETRPRRF
jgi:hypothetical protein